MNWDSATVNSLVFVFGALVVTGLIAFVRWLRQQTAPEITVVTTPATTAPVPARTSPAGATPATPTPTTPASPPKKFWKETWFGSALMLVLAAVIAGGSLWLYSSGALKNIPLMLWFLIAFGLLLVLCGVRQVFKGKGGLGFIAFGALIIFFAHPVEVWTNKTVLCTVNGDCQTRLSDIPTISDGGSILVLAGTTKSFYLQGTVAVMNYSSCYFLRYDDDMFSTVSEAGGRLNKMSSRSGKTELAVVTSVFDVEDEKCQN